MFCAARTASIPAVTGGERRAFEDLGLRVRELRLARAWTQEDASEHLQLDVRELQRVEAGEVNLTLRKLVRIARAFSVSLRELFDVPTMRASRKPGRPRTEGAVSKVDTDSKGPSRTSVHRGEARDREAKKKRPR